MVSHDRDFLQGLSSKIYEFKDHHIKEYLGDIDYYLEQRNIQNMREAEKRTKIVSEDSKKSTTNKEVYKNQKKVKSLQNKLSKIEASITKMEKEIKEIDFELSINYEETIAQSNFFESYQNKKKELEVLMDNWEATTEEIENYN